MKPPFHLWLSYWIRSYNTTNKKVLVFRRRNVFTDKWKSLTIKQVKDLTNYLAMYGEVSFDVKEDYVLFFFKSFNNDYTLNDIYLNFIENNWHEITNEDSTFDYDIETYNSTCFISEEDEVIEESSNDDWVNDEDDEDEFDEDDYIFEGSAIETTSKEDIIKTIEVDNSNTKVKSSIPEKVFVEGTIEETSNDNAFDDLEPINDSSHSIESYVTSIDNKVPSYEDSSNDRCDSCDSCDCDYE